MFNTFRIRLVLAGLWILVLALLWWGYGHLARRYDLTAAIDGLDQAAAAQDWPGADAAAAALQARWMAARPVVELNQGGLALEEFELDLHRALGALAARDLGALRPELFALRNRWEGLQSSFPDGT